MTYLPVTGAFRITATFGQQGAYWAKGHKGIDFVASDLRVFCTCNGTVTRIGWDENGWGRYVRVQDAEGRSHLFCHLVKDSVRVQVGEAVTPLTVVGTMGATGNVTGVHVHYELQKDGIAIDPSGYLGIPNRVGSYHSKDFAIKEEETMTFNDQAAIPAWAKEAVETVSEKGWMVGDDQGNFRPNDPITRAEIAVLLTRIMQ